MFVLCVDKINAYTEYRIGDVVPYNGMDFYVIKNSSSIEDSVTLLKAEPLSVEEVNRYGGVGTENNHVNMYVTQDTTSAYFQSAYNVNGYGGMVYYSNSTCGYGSSGYLKIGCKNDYALSEVKYIVDAWSRDKVPSGLKESRLIKYDELINNLGYEFFDDGSSALWKPTESTPTWIYDNNYRYWTMSSYNDSLFGVWIVDEEGIRSFEVYTGFYSNVVRPVIVLKKTILGDEEESITDSNSESDDEKKTEEQINDNNAKNEIKKTEKDFSNKSNETRIAVKVANTYMSSSIIIIILGFITASVSVLIIYKFSNKKR